VDAWNRLTPETIEDAWDICRNGRNLEGQDVELSGLDDDEYQRPISIFELGLLDVQQTK
jgi:hypothetical protein